MGFLTGLTGVFGFAKVAAVLAVAVYMFSIVADYKSQAVKITNLQHELADVRKQNTYWEGRYTRIVGLNRDKKSAIAKFEEAIDYAGCREKVDAAFQRIKQRDLVNEIFGDGVQ